MTKQALQALEYIDGLRSSQEKVLLSGEFNRIEEYKAATVVLRNLTRIRNEIEKIFTSKEDDE